MATQTTGVHEVNKLESVIERLRNDRQYQYSISAKDLGEITSTLKTASSTAQASAQLQAVWNSTPLDCRLWSALHLHGVELHTQEQRIRHIS
jgi:hypothetical protein